MKVIRDPPSEKRYSPLTLALFGAGLASLIVGAVMFFMGLFIQHLVLTLCGVLIPLCGGWAVMEAVDRAQREDDHRRRWRTD